ncbi:MAG: flagellar hook-length control protein FliK, partial [Deltaproteobacteria bacterium]
PTTGKPYVNANISGPEGFSNPHIDPTTGKPYVTANISGPGSFSNPHIDPTTGKPLKTGEISAAKEEENPTSQSTRNQTNQEVKRNNSGRFEAHLADKQTPPSSNDVQKNIGKMVTSMPESSAMLDKVKTEFRGKTVTGERKLNSDSLNSQAISGISGTKTGINEVSSAQIINRVAAEFKENLTSDGGHVKITLAPPSLGTLELDVTVRNNVVKVMLVADNKDVQQMLSGNLDSLKGSLQSQGLTIERCDVMMQDRHDQNPQNFRHQAFNQDRSANSQDGGRAPDQQDVPRVVEQSDKPVAHAAWSSGNISLFV